MGVDPEDRRGAAGGAYEVEEDVDGGGFPGTVWTEETEDFALFNGEVEVFYSGHTTELFGNVSGFDAIRHEIHLDEQCRLGQLAG